MSDTASLLGVAGLPYEDPPVWTRTVSIDEWRRLVVADNERVRAENLAQVNAFFDERRTRIEAIAAQMEGDQLIAGGQQPH